VTPDEFCSLPDREILELILTDTIPDEALVSYPCWRRICQVRGRTPWEISDELWEVICRVRGELDPEPRPGSLGEARP
jgi:hypothetical protein